MQELYDLITELQSEFGIHWLEPNYDAEVIIIKVPPNWTSDEKLLDVLIESFPRIEMAEDTAIGLDIAGQALGFHHLRHRVPVRYNHFKEWEFRQDGFRAPLPPKAIAELTGEARDWIEYHAQGAWAIVEVPEDKTFITVAFEDGSDAVHFKMKFGI